MVPKVFNCSYHYQSSSESEPNRRFLAFEPLSKKESTVLRSNLKDFTQWSGVLVYEPVTRHISPTTLVVLFSVIYF